MQLCRDASSSSIPIVDNTNVDRSLSAIHATVFNVIRAASRRSRVTLHATSGTLSNGGGVAAPDGRNARSIYGDVNLRALFEDCKRGGSAGGGSVWSSKRMIAVIRKKAREKMRLQLEEEASARAAEQTGDDCGKGVPLHRVESGNSCNGEIGVRAPFEGEGPDTSGDPTARRYESNCDDAGYDSPHSMMMDADDKDEVVGYLSDSLSSPCSSTTSLSASSLARREHDLIDVFAEWGIEKEIDGGGDSDDGTERRGIDTDVRAREHDGQNYGDDDEDGGEEGSVCSGEEDGGTVDDTS